MPYNAAPLILLTRPEAQSVRFAEACRAEFGDATGIRIQPLQEIERLGVVPNMAGVEALIFTSENGVAAYAEKVETVPDLPAYCVGGRTARAAADAGLRAVSADGDANALVALILKGGHGLRSDRALLHVRGAQSRGAVAERLRECGRHVREAVLYRQRAIPGGTAFEDLPRDRPIVVPLFSPRSAVLFAEAAKRPGTRDWRLCCFSAAVRDALPADWRAHADVAARPDAEAMLAAMAGHIIP